MLVDVEQVKRLAKLAVIAFFGFFEHVQILLQLFLASPGRAIDALQHFIAVVAAPIGSGHFHQLEMLKLAGGRHMRAATQVFEGSLSVQRDVFVGGNAGDDFSLVMLAQPLEIIDGFVARQHPTHHWLVFDSQFGHLFFNGYQVLGGERPLVTEIIIKAVLDHRTDGDLGVGKQLLDRVGQQVRCGVADHVQPFRILGSDDGNGGIARNGVTNVHQLVALFWFIGIPNLATQRGLG